MTFQPVLFGSGYSAWKLLQKTLAGQQKTFDGSAQIARDTDYFAAKIGSVTGIDQLISDRRLLGVALGAFGLTDQINSTAMIRQVLTQGTASATALANRLPDKRWLAFAETFNFAAGGTPNTATQGFATKIVSAYRSQSFTAAVTAEDRSLGTALQMQSAIPNLASSSVSESAKWYSVMGSTSMRQMMETALGLPASIVTIDIDRQLTIFQNRAAQVFGDGSVSQFSDPAKMDKLLRLYLTRSQFSGGAIGGGAAASSPALQLLGSAATSPSASGIAALFS